MPQTQPTTSQPRPPAAVGAALASATAAPAGVTAVAAIEAAIVAGAAQKVTSGMVNALRKLSIARAGVILPLAQRHAAPIRLGITPAERPPSLPGRRGALEQLAADERDREAQFQRRQMWRIRRDLPKVLAQPTERRVRERLEGLVGREAHYTRLRLDAIAVRAVGLAESLNVEARSPLGAVWQIGRTINHSPGCLFLHGLALAWGALRSARMIPPLHLRCDCRLRGLDDDDVRARALAVPTVAESLALLAEARRLEGDE